MIALSKDDKQFMQSISKRAMMLSERSIKAIDGSDIEKRQVPLKVFKRNGRDDYSFKKQLDKIYAFGFKGDRAKELIDKIDETNYANGFDLVRHQ